MTYFILGAFKPGGFFGGAGGPILGTLGGTGGAREGGANEGVLTRCVVTKGILGGTGGGTLIFGGTGGGTRILGGTGGGTLILGGTGGGRVGGAGGGRRGGTAGFIADCGERRLGIGGVGLENRLVVVGVAGVT